jgi:hypothetical protein
MKSASLPLQRHDFITRRGGRVASNQSVQANQRQRPPTVDFRYGDRNIGDRAERGLNCDPSVFFWCHTFAKNEASDREPPQLYLLCHLVLLFCALPQKPGTVRNEGLVKCVAITVRDRGTSRWRDVLIPSSSRCSL